MAILTYKDHLIVAGVDFSGTTRSWLAKVSVSWNTPGSHGIHFITALPERYPSADAAIDSGLAVGKCWVDERLKSSEPVGSLEFSSQLELR
jgi:hypothetical protein